MNRNNEDSDQALLYIYLAAILILIIEMALMYYDY